MNTMETAVNKIQRTSLTKPVYQCLVAAKQEHLYQKYTFTDMEIT